MMSFLSLRKAVALLMCCGSALLLSACNNNSNANADFHYHNGETGNLADYRGRWLIINYWAVWCKPCVEEIPELNHFAEQQRGIAAILGVDYDQLQGEALQQAIDKLAIAFPVLLKDPSAALGYPRPTVLPTTLIFNPDGQLHRTLLGPQTLHSLQAALTTTAAPPPKGDTHDGQ